MHMMKYSRSYRSIKTFGIRAIHYGLLRYDGSNHGAGNKTRYGTICESPTYCLLTISHHMSSHIPVPMLTYACGTSENTKIRTQVCLRLSTQTGSKGTLR